MLSGMTHVQTTHDDLTREEVRQSRLALIRNDKMARSSHAYVRGSTVEFYRWLGEGNARLPQGPNVWICGDCHIGNLGPIADLKGRVAVQIRDLDQTVIGNPAHDVVRLGLSLASAARGSDLPGMTTVRILEHLIAGYSAALAGDFEAEVDRAHRSKVIQGVLGQSVRRTWRDLANERLDGRPRFPKGRRFWPMSEGEREAVRQLVDGPELGDLLTRQRSRADGAPVELLDAAYWLKGCSSLGRLRYAALVRIGKGRTASEAVVDIKEAVEAAAPKAGELPMPADNAQRVVAGALALSPNLGSRMIASNLMGRSVFIRELMPQDLKIEVNQLSPDSASALAKYLGSVVGRAHGRQMDGASRASWIGELDKRRLAAVDTPSWLWRSVVELLGQHEAAYLEHCRRHASDRMSQETM
jgi:uncharacterized protein (DUF2252 family)